MILARSGLLGRSGRRIGVAVEEPAGADPLGHLAGFGPVDAAVLELDHRVLALARDLLELVALPRAQRALDQLVLDALLVERLLHFPAWVRVDLHPLHGAAMELDRHLATLDRPPLTGNPGVERAAPGPRNPDATQRVARRGLGRRRTTRTAEEATSEQVIWIDRRGGADRRAGGRRLRQQRQQHDEWRKRWRQRNRERRQFRRRRLRRLQLRRPQLRRRR